MQFTSVSNALAGQRASKKRAEDDVKLLANRLALLKLEEKKVSRDTNLIVKDYPSPLRSINMTLLR